MRIVVNTIEISSRTETATRALETKERDATKWLIGHILWAADHGHIVEIYSEKNDAAVEAME